MHGSAVTTAPKLLIPGPNQPDASRQRSKVQIN